MGKTEQTEHVIERADSKTVPPSMFKVLLNNDDYTPMDFVIEVLRRYFNMNEAHATETMLAIHHQGKAVCGVFAFGIAETKVIEVNQFARQNQHPLLCTLEKD